MSDTVEVRCTRMPTAAPATRATAASLADVLRSCAVPDPGRAGDGGAGAGAVRASRRDPLHAVDLPLLQAFDFVVRRRAGGGVNGSLNLDGHGKTQSFRLLSLTVRVRWALAKR